MVDKRPTVYANLINVRMTPNELVFEFGNYFPTGQQSAEQQQGPGQWEPEVRVVVPAQLAASLAKALFDAARGPAAASEPATPAAEPSAKAR